MTIPVKCPSMIMDFSGSYWFLNNFAACDQLIYQGKEYSTSEHAFQAQKLVDLKMREQIRLAANPSIAKSMGRRCVLRSDWEQIKLQVMEEVLRAKFSQNPKFKFSLLRTGTSQLIEGNTWHDNIWGVCLCSDCVPRQGGQNLLGLTLMKLRDEFRNGKTGD